MDRMNTFYEMVFVAAVCAADDDYYIFIPDKICFDWLQLLLCQFRLTVFQRIQA